MAEPQIRFNDGAAYEQFMGVWSRLAGEVFIKWLAPASDLRWIDVGCGNGAFTDLLIERCAPRVVQGIDPSEAQLAFARTRVPAAKAEFRVGDAMALPFADHGFDVAVMALVIFFVPDPVKGVAEMARVVAPGGAVAAYAWDMEGGGFPAEPVLAELRALGFPPPRPPSVDASRLEAMQKLWTGAGLREVETRQIEVQRSFADFEDFWSIILKGPSIGAAVSAMSPSDLATLKAGVRARLSADAAGRITSSARANAIKGRVPG